MSRAERLLSLIEVLRRHRAPVSGSKLAEELGISLRSLYRDIATLQGQGATIEGEAGVGYILRPGFLLPPLMFSESEIEAVVLGSRWVAKRGDDELSIAARNALAKILAVLPPEMRDGAESSALIVGPGEALAAGDRQIGAVRKAIRAERKLSIAYRGEAGRHDPAHDLAVRARLFRPRSRGRGVVRVARGLSPFSDRPDRRARRCRRTLSPPSGRVAEGLARSRGRSAAMRAGRRRQRHGLLLVCILVKNQLWKNRIHASVFVVRIAGSVAPIGAWRRFQRQEIWLQRKRLCSPCNPLKRLKIAERMFGKAWRFQAKNLEMFGKCLEKAWTARARRGPRP